LLAELCRLHAQHRQPLNSALSIKYSRQLLLPRASIKSVRCCYYLILSCALRPCLVMWDVGGAHSLAADDSVAPTERDTHRPRRKVKPGKRKEHKHHDDFPLFTYRLHWSLNRLFYDALSLGIPFPALISSLMGHCSPDAATLLSRYPGIVSDLCTGLPEHQLLRPGLHRPGQLHFGTVCTDCGPPLN